MEAHALNYASWRRLVFALLFAVSAAVAADDYPSKSVRMVIPFTAGGFSDVVGRIVSQRLSGVLGQPVVNDNRPGASGIIGTDIVARAVPDGYTLLLSSFNHVVNPSLLRTPYDAVTDFAAISLIAEGPPLVTMVSPASSVKTIKDLIELSRSSERLNYGSSGIGTSGHLIGELFIQSTGARLQHVPYKGSGASMTAILSGEVTMVSAYMPIALPQVRSGRLRALAVTGARRSAQLPDVPTMVESGVSGLVVSGFVGLLAPARTPAPIVQRLHAAVVKLSKDAEFVKQYAAFDMTPVASTPQELVRYTREQIAKWAKVVKTAGIKM